MWWLASRFGSSSSSGWGASLGAGVDADSGTGFLWTAGLGADDGTDESGDRTPDDRDSDAGVKDDVLAGRRKVLLDDDCGDTGLTLIKVSPGANKDGVGTGGRSFSLTEGDLTVDVPALALVVTGDSDGESTLDNDVVTELGALLVEPLFNSDAPGRRRPRDSDNSAMMIGEVFGLPSEGETFNAGCGSSQRGIDYT